MPARSVLKWLVLTGLGAEILLCLLVESLALFVGGMATDSGTPFAILSGALIIIFPLIAAALLILLAIRVWAHGRYIILGGLTVCLIAAGAVWLYFGMNQRRITPPQITQGQDLRPQTASGSDPAKSRLWSEILASRFPKGTSSSVLREALSHQGFGFGVIRTVPYADYHWFDGPCYFSLTVYWSVDDQQRLVSIWGDPRRVICETIRKQ